MEIQEPTLDIRNLLWTLRRYTWLIILSIEVSLCAGAIYYKRSTPLYQSQILVSVGENTQQFSAIQPLVSTERTVDDPRQRASMVESKIRDRAFLLALVQRLKLNQDPNLRAQAAEAARRWQGITPDEYVSRLAISQVGKKITISPGRGTFIKIVVTDVDPESARRLAGFIGDALIEESRRSELARLQARGEFSNDQIAVYEERVRKAEEALQTFQESTLRQGLTSGPITPGNLDDARSLQRSSDEEMAQLRARIQSGRDEWAAATGGTAVPDLTDTKVVEWTSDLGTLEGSYAASMLTGGPDSRNESDLLQRRIAATRQSLFEEFNQLAQGLPGDLSDAARSSAAGIALDGAVLKSVRARRDSLANMINTYLHGVERSPREEIELQRLKADVQSSRDLLNTLQKEATSSRLSEALATSALGPQIDVVEAPLLPLAPSFPQPLRIFGLAALMGPLLAGGIVYAGEKLALVLRTLEQAETEFGVKVIGTVPRIDGWARPGGYFRNHWPMLAVIAVLLLTCAFFVVDASMAAHRSSVAKTALGLVP